MNQINPYFKEIIKKNNNGGKNIKNNNYYINIFNKKVEDYSLYFGIQDKIMLVKNLEEKDNIKKVDENIDKYKQNNNSKGDVDKKEIEINAKKKLNNKETENKELGGIIKIVVIIKFQK